MFLVFSQFSFVLEAQEWTQTQHTAHTFLFVYSRLYIFLQRSRTAATYICTSIFSLTWRDSLLLTIYIHIHMSWYRSDLRRRALSSHACTKLTGNQRLVYFCRIFWHIQIQKKHHTFTYWSATLHRFKFKGQLGKYNMEYGLHYTSIHLVHTSC